MPEAQAAPAPTATAAPATAAPATTEPVAAPGGEAPNAAPPKKGKARHAEIRAQLAAKTAPTAETPAADAKPADAKTTPPATTEPEKPKPAVGAVMRLTSENQKLKSELDEVRTKLETSSKGETVEALRARVKADPAVLFDMFGEDIDADEDKRWTRLVDSIRDRNDPASAGLREVEKLKKELADRDAKAAEEAKARTESERAARRREHTAKILTEGFKDEIGEAIVDASKYPYVNHLTKVGEVDAHAGVSATVRDMVIEFEKAQKRQPTDTEIAKFIGIAAEQAETYFSKRAKNWHLEQQAAPPPPAPTEQRRVPTTIGSGLGGRDPGGIDTKKLSAREKHALIRERLRTAARQPAN
jgi:regulator of replication initiation timing